MAARARFTVVAPNGVEIACDTPADAIELARAIAEESPATEPRSRRENPSAENRRPARIDEDGDGVWEEQESEEDQGWHPSPVVRTYLERLNRMQRAVLTLIARAGGEIDIDAIRTKLRAKSNREISVLLWGCRRFAAKCGLDWKEIVQVRIVGARTDRTSLYSAGRILRGEVADTATK